MELHELLQRVDAPDELTERVRARQLDFEQAWESCDRADHRLWLAAVGGAPIENLIEAAAAAVLHAEERFSTRAGPVAEAIECAVAGAHRDVLLSVAQACERVAEGGGGEYREATPPGYDAVARGAALLAHAAEGQLAAEASREAGRLEEARHRGATLGAGASIALPPRAGPPRLEVLAGANDPAQGALLFCVAAAAEAAREAEAALSARGAPEAAARAEIDRVARASLVTGEDER